MPDVLHVRVVAPLETRIRRVQEKEGLTAEEARNRVIELDQASAGWVKHIYDADPADPALYDLVISTGKISPATAADLVIQAMACLPALT
jgi:cytidylate kinase